MSMTISNKKWKSHKRPNQKSLSGNIGLYNNTNTLNEIVLFEENFSEPTLATWIVF
jgi:hypothetical protein